MGNLGKVAVIGSGSWATALAKLLLNNCDRIAWYFRREDRIEEFIRYGHNPVYLSDVSFDPIRIDFFSDINDAVSDADTLLVAVPSPYFLSEARKITADISDKIIVSAVKGIVPEENTIVTEYFKHHFGCKDENMLVIGGPCHAEEVALSRLSYLTIGCHDTVKATEFASLLGSKNLRTILSDDVEGIEYAAVLKNVYAIAAGMADGMKLGDNFLAMLVCNSLQEMRRFIDTTSPLPGRDVARSAYLGDLLVTSYSKFSRNHNLGAMIGKGHSVKAVMMEMRMVAEGYYGVKCIRDINRHAANIPMPILECVYSILYGGKRPRFAFDAVIAEFC